MHPAANAGGAATPWFRAHEVPSHPPGRAQPLHRLRAWIRRHQRRAASVQCHRDRGPGASLGGGRPASPRPKRCSPSWPRCRSRSCCWAPGPRLSFPHPRLTQPLRDAGIGLEVMDTAAACRTYNILLGKTGGSPRPCWWLPWKRVLTQRNNDPIHSDHGRAGLRQRQARAAEYSPGGRMLRRTCRHGLCLRPSAVPLGL